MSEGELILYRTDDGLSRIELRAVDGTAWLTQAQMTELFQTSPQAISQLIAAIYEDAEADEAATCKQHLQVRQEGSREVSWHLKHHNLNVNCRAAEALAADEADIAGLEELEKDAKGRKKGGDDA